jgi:hypothetical protein
MLVSEAVPAGSMRARIGATTAARLSALDNRRPPPPLRTSARSTDAILASNHDASSSSKPMRLASTTERPQAASLMKPSRAIWVSVRETVSMVSPR